MNIDTINAAVNVVAFNDELDTLTAGVSSIEIVTTPAPTSAGVLKQIEQNRIEWEEGVYRTSNQKLYAILADCLAFGANLTDTEECKKRNAVLDKFYDERGYRKQENTPLLTRIVRAVFGDVDRRRISTYSLVLRAAKAASVVSNDLPKWIEDNGGVQEIRLAKSKSYVSPQVKRDIGEKGFETAPALASVKSDALAGLFNTDDVGKKCVLFAELQADGSYQVRAVLRSAAVTTAAYAEIYASQSKVQAAADDEMAAAA